MEMILTTERLILRPFTSDDAAFYLELLNDEAFIRHIGDKQIGTIEEAASEIENKVTTQLKENGYGPLCVTLKNSDEPIGLCGLINRPELEYTDLGYAFLERFRGKGYAFEAAVESLRWGTEDLNLLRIDAIVSPANDDSKRLLEKLGFVDNGQVKLAADQEPIDLLSFIAE